MLASAIPNEIQLGYIRAVRDPAVLAEELLPEAIVFDVDGTLCDVRQIRHYVEPITGESEFRANFDRFHAESIRCPAHQSVMNVLARARTAKFKILIVTGREAKWSFLTSLWLAEKGIKPERVYMRQKGDFRPDHVIKQEILTQIEKKYRVCLAVDDREDIIAVWSDSGIPTLKVSVHGQLRPINWPSGVDKEARIEQIVSGLHSQKHRSNLTGPTAS
jgi:hypothetical protein